MRAMTTVKIALALAAAILFGLGIRTEMPALRSTHGEEMYSAAVYDPDGSTVEAFFTDALIDA